MLGKKPNRTLRTSGRQTTVKYRPAPRVQNKKNESLVSKPLESSAKKPTESQARKSPESQTRKPIESQIRKPPVEPEKDVLVFDSESDSESTLIEKPELKPTLKEKPKIVSKIEVKPINQKITGKPRPAQLAQKEVKILKEAKEVKSVQNATEKTPMSADIYNQAIDLIYQCDPEQNCSKEELIERLERKRDRLPETDPQRPNIDYLLQQLIAEERQQKINNLEETRDTQDKIVQKNKLKPEHFRAKTNLAPENGDYTEYGEDEHLKILVSSKKLFEKIKHYQKLPSSKENPFAKGKLRGNRKPPPDLMQSIDAKFQKPS